MWMCERGGEEKSCIWECGDMKVLVLPLAITLCTPKVTVKINKLAP